MSIALTLSLKSHLRRSLSFSPFTLFTGGEEGVWYDPSDLTTLFQDTAGTTPVTTPGQTVALMLDKSGNDHHATQSTAAARPTYQVDAGGRGYLSFDGVDDSMVTPTITPGTDKVQVFAGVRKLDTDDYHCLLEYGTDAASANNTFAIWSPWNIVNAYGFLLKGTAVGSQYRPETYTAPTTNVLTGLFDLAGADLESAITPRVDGVVDRDKPLGGAPEGGPFASAPLYIGARTGSSFFLNGHIYSLITRFGPNLDAPVIGKTETYVAKKTGVDLT